MKKQIKAMLFSAIFLSGISSTSVAQNTQVPRADLMGNKVELKKATIAIKTLDIQPDEIIAYKTVGDVTLNVEVFKPTVKVDGPTPCVVFFFGGGFKVGNTFQFYPQAKYLALRGITSVCVEYRTKTQHGTSPFECVTDAKSAMRWVRSHATELGIDPNRIAASGNSAGAYLSATVATANCLDEAGEDTSVSCVPEALILYNTAFDRGPGTTGFNTVEKKLGDNWKCVSPLHSIKPGFPPTLFMIGTNDRFTTVDEAKLIETEIQKVGSRCEMRIYDGQEHSFFMYGWGDGAHYSITLQEVDKFLVSLGWLKAL